MTPFPIVDNHHYNLHLSMHLHAKIFILFENQMITSLSLNVSMSLIISMGHTEIGNGPIWHPLVLYETRVMSRMTKRATSRDSATRIKRKENFLLWRDKQTCKFFYKRLINDETASRIVDPANLFEERKLVHLKNPVNENL